jgi:cation diffusion facilitator CzcD-associated flavoprotein CzcO
VYTYTLDFDFIVVCSGTFTDPKTILHPDQIDFTEGAGEKVMHSSEYKNVSNDMKDRCVVIIGGSKSAADIAVHAAEKAGGAHQGQVTLLYRRHIWRIPPYIVVYAGAAGPI